MRTSGSSDFLENCLDFFSLPDGKCEAINKVLKSVYVYRRKRLEFLLKVNLVR